jgi:hypothetical protein
MKKIFLLSLALIAIQTTVQAENFGAGFATGAFTGLALSKITEGPRYYDPVAEAEAAGIRADLKAQARARREEERLEREEKRAEAKRQKTIKKEMEQLKKEIKLEKKKLDREKNLTKIDLYSESIEKMEIKLQDLQDEIDA